MLLTSRAGNIIEDSAENYGKTSLKGKAFANDRQKEKAIRLRIVALSGG